MSSEYWLAHGPHATPEDGRCAMEWVSYLAGEPHSDQPACVSPALRSFCVALNDGLEKNTRQRLRPYLTRTIGTSNDGLDDGRSWMAMDWLIRVYTPAWLHLADLAEAAQRLALLAPLGGVEDLAAALDTLDVARADAHAALRAAVRGSFLARVLPSAAGRPARKAAWASGEAAVWVVARVPVGGAGGECACDAARVTAADAAAAAAHQARARADTSSPEDAARSALTETVAALHRSALTLLDRMLPTETLAELSVDAPGDLSPALG